MKGWVRDLALGIRLSVGGSRSSGVRIGLSAAGIACAVAVLLLAASIGTMHERRENRQYLDVANENPIDGVNETWLAHQFTEFRGQDVRIYYVAGTAPDSPKPAGLPKLPADGEQYTSPKLAELLRSAEGELLRPRLPEKIVGELPDDLVTTPGDYVAWVGVDAKRLQESRGTAPVYGFGMAPTDNSLNPSFLVLLLIGAVVLLLPVFVFITSASRIAGAERDRRLSALRLVGASAREVRRIAAGESLVGAFGGLVVGAVMFVVVRQFAEDVSLFGERAYVEDVVPNPWLALLVVLAIPALTIMTALFALRRTIIEPLGVVRQTKPVRRRVWWRLALIGFGIVLMTTQLGAKNNSDLWAWSVSGGAALLLVGVPVLLPWLVERVAGRLSGGPSSWLLAIRRLQLDSGTSARVVGGVAVVLAGAIALQTVLMSVEGSLKLPGTGNEPVGTVETSVAPHLVADVDKKIRAADGVTDTNQIRYNSGYEVGATDNSYGVAIADCKALKALAKVKQCTDGDVFLASGQHSSTPAQGTEIEWREFPPRGVGNGNPDDYTVTGTWTIPATAKKVTRPENTTVYATILITPGAIDPAIVQKETSAIVVANVTTNLTSDQLEGIHNAVADYRIEASVFSNNTGPDLTSDQKTYVSIRTALYAGSIFTLLLAGVSLLVLALEHIRERRRPLAVLAASGVPRSVLARSLLWQVALPIALGTAVALATGVGLAALVTQLTNETLTIDWSGVAFLSAGAITLSLLISALTMPFLRNATRLTTLRTE